MAGLSKNNSTYVLKQWYQLFSDKRVVRSNEAYAHWQNVERMGLPTCQHEHWKYTPIDEIFKYSFTLPSAHIVSGSDRDRLSLSLNAYRLVFVNGCLIPALSDDDIGVWKVEVEKGLTRQPLPAPINPEVFLHLTESLVEEVTRIYLPASESSKRPLYLLHISQGHSDKEMLSMIHYRHHLDVGVSSKGQIIEHFVSVNSQKNFSGSRMSMMIHDNSHLCHTKLAFESCASYHFGHNDINVGCDAVVRSSVFLLGASLSRHQTSVQLNGERSNLAINSLLVPSGQSINDTRTYLEHNKGYCSSCQLHKVIARDHGKGVFNGMIRVAKHALKTDSSMINSNLLLDHSAEVNTKPHLEIYADDVKCSHGVTVGQINLEQIFYLQSRGISRKNAQQMIIYAFAAEATEIIEYNAVRDAVLTRLANTLRGTLV